MKTLRSSLLGAALLGGSTTLVGCGTDFLKTPSTAAEVVQAKNHPPKTEVTDATPPASGETKEATSPSSFVLPSALPDHELFPKMLSHENPRMVIWGLDSVAKSAALRDDEKIALLKTFLQQHEKSQGQRPVNEPAMEEDLSLFLGQVFYAAVASLKHDAEKVRFLQQEALPPDLSQQLPQQITGVLNSFSSEAIVLPSFQKQLAGWVKTLISSGEPSQRAAGAVVLGAEASPGAEGISKLVLADKEMRADFLYKLLDDPDLGVQLNVLQSTVQHLRDAAVQDTERAKWIQALLLLAQEQARQDEKPASPILHHVGMTVLQGLGTIQEDKVRLSLVAAFGERNCFEVTTETIPAFAEVLSRISEARQPERNLLLSALRQSENKHTRQLATLAMLHIPEHPDFLDVLSTLNKSSNPQVVSLSAEALHAVKDPDLKRTLHQRVLHFRQEELGDFLEVVRQANQQHNEIDDRASAVPDEETRQKLLQELYAVFDRRDAATAQLNSIADVVTRGIQAIPDFADDPAHQYKVLSQLVRHPLGKVRLAAVRRIRFLENDAQKAELIRFATSIEENKPFYTLLEDPAPGELPFYDEAEQTPFESISSSAALSLMEIKDPAIKVPLMLELAKHPVFYVRLNVISALPTLSEGHAALKDSILFWAKEGRPIVAQRLQENLRDFPVEDLKEVIQALRTQDLDRPEDSDETGGWRSRLMAATLLPLLPASEDAFKVDGLKALAQDRLSPIQYRAWAAGLPVQSPEGRTELVRFYLSHEVPHFKALGLSGLKGTTLPVEEQLSVFQNAVTDSSPQVRAAVAQGISQFPPSSERESILVSLATDAEVYVRMALCEALAQPAVTFGEKGLAGVADVLSPLCQDSPDVRKALVPVLKRVEDPKLKETLLKSLFDTEDESLKLELMMLLRAA